MAWCYDRWNRHRRKVRRFCAEWTTAKTLAPHQYSSRDWAVRAFASFLIACLTAATAAAQRADSGTVQLVVPQSVGEWVFAGRHDYPDPALGVLVRYRRSDSLRADVFAYPGPDFATRCPMACAKNFLERGSATLSPRSRR